MPIPPQDVRRIAALANLKFSPEEISRYSEDLSRILDYIDQLKEVEAEATPPLVRVFDRRGLGRSDYIGPSPPGKSALQNAPDRQGNFFKVPRVIE
jgi:aspartyl-tRNA(Asn)/glutamyl-tRNA(Gln) amidotransferase subunit C